MSTLELLQRGGRIAAMGWLAASRWGALGALIALHSAALVLVWLTEPGWAGRAVFVLTWVMLNGFWLAVLRRPAVAALLSLLPVVLVVLLSTFKYSVLWMTLNFLDVLIIDPDTISFLLTILPELSTRLLITALIGVPLTILLWRIDPFRVRRAVAASAAATSLFALAALGTVIADEPSDHFHGKSHVSLFVRSGFAAASTVTSHGWMEADPATADRLRMGLQQSCTPARKPPHIILVLDESSFDIAAATGAKVPAGYADHFKSFDGKTRSFVVEGVGGPTWYTEYNVLTGLSVRSFGRNAYFVTRLAAGRVERGLPHALRNCGYKTFTLYPAYGAFLSARSFQTGVGIDRLIDSQDMKTGTAQPDSFYYDQTLRLIARERGTKPLFVFTYLAANHFPWDKAFRPELTPDWRAPGNHPHVDEYIRRQTMSAHDYRAFVARLKREYPDESFLIVRFGDHQPPLAEHQYEASIGHAEFMRRVVANDPRYYSTYYAIEPVNFKPADLSSALSPLDAAYLPLVIQEAAGLPIDPTFAEQKKILERCRGAFYLCAGGAEARRFNRLLVDAGLIKGMVSR